MADLEMAGAPPEEPGADGLTISDLPDDMLIYILSMMDIETLLVVAKVCTRWQQLCMTPYMCKNKSLIVNRGDYVEKSKKILPVFGKCFKNVQVHTLSTLEAAPLRASLVSYCPNLTHLTIKMNELDGGILDDLPHWPNLEFLRFDIYVSHRKVRPRHTARNSAHSVPYVARNLKTLEIIIISNSLEAAQFCASILSYCPNLTHLKIHARVDRSIFESLHHLPNLKFLNLFGTIIIYRCDRGTYNIPFDKMKYLEKLILSYFPLTHDSFYSMLECENIVSINLKKLTDIPADFLIALVRTKQSTLRALHIHGDTLNDAIMRHISNCRQLQVLWIRTCDTLSDSSLLHLSNLKNLQSLDLFEGDFSESAMLELISNNKFKQMTHLRIQIDLRSTPQVIKIIKRNFPILKKISYRYRVGLGGDYCEKEINL